MIRMLLILFLLCVSPAWADVTRTVANANPTELETKVRAIPGFPTTGISVYRTTGTGALVYLAGTLTPQQENDLDALLAAYVPDFTALQQVQALRDEVKTNDLCSAELQQITDRINQVRDQAKAAVAAAGTVIDLKAALASYLDAQAVVDRKEARCVRARAR